MTHLSFFRNAKKVWIVVVGGAVAGVIFFALAFQFVQSISYADSDFFSFWYAGHSVLTGNDPYNESYWVNERSQFGAVWVSDATFLYPLPLAVLLVPLGLFPLLWAYTLWVALSLVLALLSGLMILSVRDGLQRKAYAIPILLALPLFRPLLVALHNGQISAALLFALALFVLLWERGLWFLGGIALAILALKPGIGLPFLVLMGGWAFRSRKRSGVAGLAAGLVGLCIIGLAKDPWWVMRFQAIGSGKMFSALGFSATLWGIAGLACHQAKTCTLLAGGTISLILVSACVLFLLFRGDRLAPIAVASLGVVVVLLVTPYLWPYDQTLLILPIIFAVSRLFDRAPYLLSATLFLFYDLLGLVLFYLALATGHEAPNSVLTLAVLILVAINLGAGGRGDRVFTELANPEN